MRKKQPKARPPLKRARPPFKPIDRIKQVDPKRLEQRREILGILLVFLSILGLWTLYTQPENGGLVDYYLRTGCELTAGEILSFLPLLYLLGLGLYLIVKRSRPAFFGPWLGFTLLSIVILSGFDLIVRRHTETFMVNTHEGGGLVGGIVAGLARQAFGLTGAWLMNAALVLIALVLITGKPLAELAGIFRARLPKVRADLEKPASAAAPEPTRAAGDRRPEPEAKLPQSTPAVNEAPVQPVAVRKSLPCHGYSLPGTDLLNPPSLVKPARPLPDQRRQLEATLASFGVQARVIEVHKGPVITRYDLQPAAGVKVSRIVNLADDLALALAARGLRIEAPIPGKAALGIEVPNKEARSVSLREVIESKEFAAGGLLSFALGRDIGGEVVVGDLARMPHLLIAGATGSGKSVCLNTIIMSLLYKAGPNRIKMIMIDPKMVELTAYNGIPHLIAPVVTEAKRAPSALKWAVKEMEQRYRRLMQAGTRDIDAYNRAQTDPEEIMPYIVIIVDELADLMMIARVEVEDSICRLAQMARATGMHLIIATQRPSVDVITGLIKANIPSRIAFAVSSITDSRTILDSGGAERLLGRGDMLYSPVGVLKPRRIQGALVMEEEIKRVVQFWQAQAEQATQPSEAPPDFEAEINRENKDSAAEDDLFWEAVRVVVEFKQASASILQRRLRIGYSRAARLVDLMEARGFVGPFEGSKPREVRITAEQLAAMRE